jgi:intracellular multiplication protein IcmB
MYMLARYLVAGDFYVAPEHYEALTREQLPDQYRRGHIEGARRLKEEVKEIVYDEFHRTRGQQACRDQVLLDIREGPKHNVGVALFSQMADDFDEAMRALETTLLNFGAAAAIEIDRMVDEYGLPEAARAVMRHRMRKPSAAGSHVLARFRTASGDYVHHLMVTAGPRLLWALSTTPADVGLRSRVYDALGGENARTALARRFPGGTAEPEIERRIERRRATGGAFAEEEGQEVIDSLAREIIEAFRLARLGVPGMSLGSAPTETDPNRAQGPRAAEPAAG